MGPIEFLIIFGWTWAVAAAGYKIGYSEGHNDATIHAVRVRQESMLEDDEGSNHGELH